MKTTIPERGARAATNVVGLDDLAIEKLVEVFGETGTNGFTLTTKAVEQITANAYPRARRLYPGITKDEIRVEIFIMSIVAFARAKGIDVTPGQVRQELAAAQKAKDVTP